MSKSNNTDSQNSGTLQTGDKMGTVSAVILFIFTLINGGLTIVSALIKTATDWDWSMFFLLFTPTLQGAISIFVYKLTGQQIQDNNVVNKAREELDKKAWQIKESNYIKQLEEKDSRLNKIEHELAEARSRDRFYNGTLGVDEWLKKQFHTSFGLFPKNQSSMPPLSPFESNKEKEDEDDDIVSHTVDIVSNNQQK